MGVLAAVLDAGALLLFGWFLRPLLRESRSGSRSGSRTRPERVPGEDGGGSAGIVLIGVSLILLSVPLWSRP
ncbi:hypothetical protein [Actinomadura rubrisoli]|uniref:Uncharacterized protein n=1 Tax=Actinomadura rubrisoli TaxID=2530368 RepID=A0A4V2YUI1_9ACTN|nr:hypothetical protein [Actinomadura rubrisoli]TDD77877.1 hypothetical protein E1298_29335 [Actinomadura rubrisoli]